MAVPVVETTAVTESGGTVTTLSLTNPTGLTAGDIYLVIHASDHSNPTLPEHTAPTGTGATFTEIDIFGANNADTVISAWWHEWTGSEGTISANQTNSAIIQAITVRVSGVDTADVVDGVSTPSSGGSSTSHVIAGFTTGQADTLAFYVIAADGADTLPHSVSGTGWAEVAEGNSGGAGGVGPSFGTKDMASAGATGDATVTLTSSDGAAWFQFALNGESATVSPKTLTLLGVG